MKFQLFFISANKKAPPYGEAVPLVQFLATNFPKGIDKSPSVWYHEGVGATGNGHYPMSSKKITALLVEGRLSFFVYTDDQAYDRHDQRAEHEKGFPCHNHVHHLPLYRVSRKEKRFRVPRKEEATAAVWATPTGSFRIRVPL